MLFAAYLSKRRNLGRWAGVALRFMIPWPSLRLGLRLGWPVLVLLGRVTRRGSLDPTVYNVLTMLDLWLPFGTLGRMLCLSARILFALALLRWSVILVRSSECRSVWLGLAGLGLWGFPLLGVGFLC